MKVSRAPGAYIGRRASVGKVLIVVRMHEDARSPAERVVGRDIDGQTGRKLSNDVLRYERSVDAYLKAGVRPRWMERLMEIERAKKRAHGELERLYAELRDACGDDAAGFARRWRAVAGRWDFEAVNELVRVHNEWYPVERDLPIDPRTGEYRLITGRSYRREELGAAWILANFPAT
jgi:hypothetical protein